MSDTAVDATTPHGGFYLSLGYLASLGALLQLGRAPLMRQLLLEHHLVELVISYKANESSQRSSVARRLCLKVLGRAASVLVQTTWNAPQASESDMAAAARASQLIEGVIDELLQSVSDRYEL